MRNVWATALSVWALSAVVAFLAWTRQQPTPARSPQSIPNAVIVKGKNGTSRLVIVSGEGHDDLPRHDPYLAGARRISDVDHRSPVASLIARARLVAFALLTASVTLGLMMSTRLLKPQFQKDVLGWHQTLIWTGLSMVVLHAGAIVLDP